MLFGVIGGIIFCIAVNISERLTRKEELKKAEASGYEVYFTY